MSIKENEVIETSKIEKKKWIQAHAHVVKHLISCVNESAFRDAVLNDRQFAIFGCAHQLSCRLLLNPKESTESYDTRQSAESAVSMLIHEGATLKLTTTAASFTARTQVIASCDEQWLANCSALLRVIVISRNSKTSPAKSSDKSTKSWFLAASWTVAASRAHKKREARAVAVAQRKEGSKW